MRIFFLFSFSLLLLVSCGKKTETTSPMVEDISESVYASGVVKSQNQYEVFATVNGIIKQILVNEGDVVKKGDPLINVENAAAELQAENARLAADYNRLSANTEKLNELHENIRLARIKKSNDSSMWVRQGHLWSQNIGSKVEFEQKELNYKSSEAAYRLALLRYKDVKEQLEFAARQADKNLEISETLAGVYTIKSEANGKVYSILKEKGEIVNPQFPVAIIGDANAFMLELQVDEYDIARIKPGQKVLLNLDSYKGRVFEAKVTKINPAMNERTRSFTVEAAFTTIPPKLFPNLTTEANIIIRSKQNALTIPRAYLVDGTYVLKDKDEKVKVKVGVKDYQKVEILEGLSKDDEIVKPAL